MSLKPGLSTIISILDEGFMAWNSAWSELREAGFPPTQQVVIAKAPTTLQRINKRLLTLRPFLTTTRYSRAFKPALVPDALRTQLHKEATNFKTSAEQVISQATAVRAAGGYAQLNPQNLQVTAKNDTVVPINQLQATYQHAQQVLLILLQIYPVLRPGTRINLGKLGEEIQQHSEQLEQALGESREILERIGANDKQATEKLGSIHEYLGNAEDELARISTLKKNVEQAEAEVEARRDSANETANSARELQTRIDTYAERFEEFDSALTNRLETLARADEETATAKENNEKREAEIERLLGKADELIRGATVAGLASSFSSQHDIYSLELRHARIAFYVSIFVLTVLAVPLLFYVLPLEGGLSDVLSLSESGQVTTGGVIARLVLLLPGVWLTRFNSRRFSRLFALREEYAHKAALAKSIEGFRREAPDYEDEVTAAVFWDLTRRGRRQSGHADVPNPILRKILDRMEGAWGDEEPEEKA